MAETRTCSFHKIPMYLQAIETLDFTTFFNNIFLKNKITKSFIEEFLLRNFASKTEKLETQL
ncbi:MAG: hypothetical protein LBV08_03695 [Clostridiales bacterium]|nr:hypothetical protein [Clostridiales bacterium]